MKQAIVVLGGYNSLWTAYLRMARELEAWTGLQAVGVPLMPWHWWSAERAQDATIILQRLRKTLVWARRKYQADRFILVGHSAGGVVARLYLCDKAVWGQVYCGVEQVTALVTLGSPHCSDGTSKLGWFLTEQANRLAPGTPKADLVRYHTVAGRSVLGDPSGTWRERRAYRSYAFFCEQGNTWGDGVVPLESACLDGAEGMVLPGVAHSRKYGAAWYGSSRTIIRRWWPPGVLDGR